MNYADMIDFLAQVKTGRRDENQWVALSTETPDIIGRGPTEKEAVVNLVEALIEHGDR